MYKLSDYARKHNVTYRTAWNRFNAGLIPDAFKADDGHIYIKDEIVTNKNKVALYCRVSNPDNKINLISQQERLTDFAIRNGFTITRSITETASGLNDQRPKLLSLLTDNSWSVLIVEHKDILTRFGFNYIKALLNFSGRDVLVVNESDDDKTDLLEDMVSIIYSFSARMYGLRRRKHKKEVADFLTKE